MTKMENTSASQFDPQKQFPTLCGKKGIKSLNEEGKICPDRLSGVLG